MPGGRHDCLHVGHVGVGQPLGVTLGGPVPPLERRSGFTASPVRGPAPAPLP